jgi:hypothetical protein
LKIGRYYGYIEGFNIFKSYLDLHSNVKPEEWSAVSAKESYTLRENTLINISKHCLVKPTGALL